MAHRSKQATSINKIQALTRIQLTLTVLKKLKTQTKIRLWLINEIFKMVSTQKRQTSTKNIWINKRALDNLAVWAKAKATKENRQRTLKSTSSTTWATIPLSSSSLSKPTMTSWTHFWRNFKLHWINQIHLAKFKANTISKKLISKCKNP